MLFKTGKNYYLKISFLFLLFIFPIEIYSMILYPFWMPPPVETHRIDLRGYRLDLYFFIDDRTQENITGKIQNHRKSLTTYLRYEGITPTKQSNEATGILDDLNIVFDARLFTVGFDLYNFIYNNVDKREINGELTYWQKYLFKKYKSVLNKVIDMNPVPGMAYSLHSNNPSNPYIFISTIDQIYYDLGTYPYTDDLRIKIDDTLKYAYGFKFIYTLY